MPEIVSGGEFAKSAEHLAAMQRSPEFQAIARRFAGLIEFEPHECEVVYIGERG